jgi:hypothetical protein
MNRNFFLLLIAVTIVVGVAVALFQSPAQRRDGGVPAAGDSRAPSVGQAGSRAGAFGVPRGGESAEAAPSPESSGDVPGARDRALAQLRADLDIALADLAEAEAALADSEREVQELEAFVAEIRARGEDPADYSGEGMARFQPAFFRYQDAAAAYGAAEQAVRDAREALLQAQQEEVAR